MTSCPWKRSPEDEPLRLKFPTVRTDMTRCMLNSPSPHFLFIVNRHDKVYVKLPVPTLLVYSRPDKDMSQTFYEAVDS